MNHLGLFRIFWGTLGKEMRVEYKRNLNEKRFLSLFMRAVLYICINIYVCISACVCVWFLMILTRVEFCWKKVLKYSDMYLQSHDLFLSIKLPVINCHEHHSNHIMAKSQFLSNIHYAWKIYKPWLTQKHLIFKYKSRE